LRENELEVRSTPELEARLVRTAAEEGRNADELVREVLAQYLADDARLLAAVGSPKDEALNVPTVGLTRAFARHSEKS
jgi:hypothetical protein